MTARILDSTGPLKGIKEEFGEWANALRGRGVTPRFGTVLVGTDPADKSSLDRKHRDVTALGIESFRRELAADASRVEIEGVIDELNTDPSCTGYVLQQPHSLDDAALSSRIDPTKDVEGLHPYNLGKLVSGAVGPLPCAPLGIIELLGAHNVPVDGTDVCIVGRGLSVGRPLALMMTRHTANATVTVCHTGTHDLAAHVRRADIVVAAAGVPGLITADMVRPGAVVVDVGLSQVDGKLTGDVAAEVAEVAGWISGNPGGVGPMTRTMLLYNILLTAERLLTPSLT